MLFYTRVATLSTSQDLLIKHKEILASFLAVPITIANFDDIELWSYSVSILLQLSSPM